MSLYGNGNSPIQQSEQDLTSLRAQNQAIQNMVTGRQQMRNTADEASGMQMPTGATSLPDGDVQWPSAAPAPAAPAGVQVPTGKVASAPVQTEKPQSVWQTGPDSTNAELTRLSQHLPQKPLPAGQMYTTPAADRSLAQMRQLQRTLGSDTMQPRGEKRSQITPVARDVTSPGAPTTLAEYNAQRQAGVPTAGKEMTGTDVAASANAGSKVSQYDKPNAYDPIIQKAAQWQGIDPAILKRLIGSESSFNPKAVSPRGAQYGYGIAQIAASHGLSKEQMEDPSVAIPFAAKLLRQYADANGGDMNKALLQYKGASSPAGIASMQPIVNGILAGAAPAQQATAPQAGQPAAQAAAPQQPATGPSQTMAPTGAYGAADYDASTAQLQLQQAQQMYRMAQWRAQNAATPQERDAALGQMQQAQMAGQQVYQGIYSNAVMTAGRGMAAGNTQAAGQLIQEMSRRLGTPLVIQQVAPGQYVLMGQNGQRVTEPGNMAQMSQQLVQVLSPNSRQVAMTNAAIEQAAMAKSRGEAAGKSPYELTLEQVKGNNALMQEIQKSLGATTLEMVKQGEATASWDPSGSGKLVVVRKNGQLLGMVDAASVGGIGGAPTPKVYKPMLPG